MVTGKVWEAAVEARPELWGAAGHIQVFARMSPEAKEAVVRAVKEQGAHTLMCGDGGNDVGALKSADVGVSLLTGFGNANVDASGAAPKAEGAAEGAKAEAALEEQTKALAVKQKEVQMHSRDIGQGVPGSDEKRGQQGRSFGFVVK